MEKQSSEKDMIVRKCFKSLIVLTLAFVQSFSAYFVLEGLQSSVNPTVGLVSLSLIYGFYCISSMFLPALVASKFKPHHILAISQILYMFYTAANFYPSAYTLIPSAIIMGLAAGPLWATARIYVGDLARIHAKAAGKEESLMTGYYFGVFYMFQASQVFGNLLIWFINSVTGYFDDQIQVQQQNTTTIVPTVISNITTTHAPPHIPECGLFYIPPTSDSGGEQSGGKINYLALTIFLIMQACSALMFSCLLIDISTLTTDEKEDSENGNNVKFSTESSKMVAPNDEAVPYDQSTGYHRDANSNNQKSLCRDSEANYDRNSWYDGGDYTDDSYVSTALGSSKAHEVMVLVNAMFKLLRWDKTAVLILLLTFHSGFLHCTVVGDFTRAWISCSKGISFVPSLLAVYGSVSTAASLLNGPLLRVLKVTTLIYFAIFIEMILWISLFWWKPSPTDSILVYILFCAGFGVSNGLIRSLLAHIYAVLYPNCLPAGMALLGSGEAISSSILFGLGDWTLPLVKVVLSMVFGLIGGVTYRNAWRLVKSERRYWKKSTSVQLTSTS